MWLNVCFQVFIQFASVFRQFLSILTKFRIHGVVVIFEFNSRRFYEFKTVWLLVFLLMLTFYLFLQLILFDFWDKTVSVHKHNVFINQISCNFQTKPLTMINLMKIHSSDISLNLDAILRLPLWKWLHFWFSFESIIVSYPCNAIHTRLYIWK